MPFQIRKIKNNCYNYAKQRASDYITAIFKDASRFKLTSLFQSSFVWLSNNNENIELIKQLIVIILFVDPTWEKMPNDEYENT